MKIENNALPANAAVRVKTSGFVGIAELSRSPDNFFDTELIGELAATFDSFVAAEMRSILLCSSGRNFCAGADFRRSDLQRDDANQLYREAVRLFRCPLPIVVAVQGAAVGGGLGLAMAGDFRVASPQSRFTANFCRLGFHPGFGLSVTLPRAIGEQNAALLFYTGRRIDGEEAKSVGLIDFLAAEDDLRTAALHLATEIAQSAPIAVQSTRATLRRGLADRIAVAIERELSEQARHIATDDFKEGVRAMADRRLPDFVGRAGFTGGASQ